MILRENGAMVEQRWCELVAGTLGHGDIAAQRRVRLTETL
jgi:hypothetical protein